MVRLLGEEAQACPATLFVVGAYHIGKERCYLGAAAALGWRVHCAPAKRRVRAVCVFGGGGGAGRGGRGRRGGAVCVCACSPLARPPITHRCHSTHAPLPHAAPSMQLLGLLGLPPDWLALLSDDPAACQLHVLGMGEQMHPAALAERVAASDGRWVRAVAVRPTGELQQGWVGCMHACMCACLLACLLARAPRLAAASLARSPRPTRARSPASAPLPPTHTPPPHPLHPLQMRRRLARVDPPPHGAAGAAGRGVRGDAGSALL